MPMDRPESNTESRRTFIRRIGAGTLGLAAAPYLATRPAFAAPELWFQPDAIGAAPPEQLHLQFGSDASREMAASWVTPTSVKKPRLRLGRPNDGYGKTIQPITQSYVDARSKVEVVIHHAVMRDLRPDTSYVYEVLHEGAQPLTGAFKTAPRGRVPFRFTSFGDQATPVPGNGLASPWAGYLPPQVESVSPLFHLLNGDLCYANISPDRVKTWHDFFTANQVSARNRPWMPCAGNHENELGNGPFGFGAYQARFHLPDSGAPPEMRGLWYAFTAGSVRVISLNNDDVCLQDGGDSYVSGYSGGAQRRWLERELAEARDDGEIDWIVVCMHQVAISSVYGFNGADHGVRQQWLPLFDRYGVDLVVCGHEHHYERTLPVRGVDPATETSRPVPVSDRLDVVDTSRGTVHMVIGTGGTSAPSNRLFYEPPKCDVIMSVGPPPGPGKKRPPFKVTEDAVWAGHRDATDAYGFAAFDVDPGRPGGTTTMRVTFYAAGSSATATPTPVDTFTLQRPRRDDDRSSETGSADSRSGAA
jgi:Purple acid Phosphatase, N-terminal domain/Calcineurin-like phosphoesterase